MRSLFRPSALWFGFLGLAAGYGLAHAFGHGAAEAGAVAILREPLKLQATSEAALAKGPYALPPGTALTLVEKGDGQTSVYSLRVTVDSQLLEDAKDARTAAASTIVAINPDDAEERLPPLNQ